MHDPESRLVPDRDRDGQAMRRPAEATPPAGETRNQNVLRVFKDGARWLAVIGPYPEGPAVCVVHRTAFLALFQLVMKLAAGNYCFDPSWASVVDPLPLDRGPDRGDAGMVGPALQDHEHAAVAQVIVVGPDRMPEPAARTLDETQVGAVPGPDLIGLQVEPLNGHAPVPDPSRHQV